MGNDAPGKDEKRRATKTQHRARETTQPAQNRSDNETTNGSQQAGTP
jgi:hypothetical protein